VLVAVPLTLLVASLAGWGVHLLDPPRRRTALAAVVAIMLVPASGVWATRFEVFRLLGASEKLLPVMAPAFMGTSAFYVLVYVWSFRTLDEEVLAAAALDGAGPLATWWRIAMPQARGATFAVGALSFAWHWGNLIDPLLYLRSPARYTAPLGVRLLQQLAPTDWPLLMAAVTMLTVPPVVVFLVAQRWFLSDAALEGGR
jgi:multiple sugar transport system permease protein